MVRRSLDGWRKVLALHQKAATRLRGCKGFTLIELIVTMAVLAIITTGTVMLIEPSTRLFLESTNSARGNRIADDVLGLVVGELVYASNLTLSEDWGVDASVNGQASAVFLSPRYGEMTLVQENGMVFMRSAVSGSLGFGAEYYMHNKVQLGLSQNSGQLTAQLAVLSPSGKVIAFQERTARLMNQQVLIPPAGP